MGERCRGVIGARDLGRAIFMQHVSTLIMLVLPIDFFVLEVPTFVQDVPFLCFMHARSVRRIGSMDFEPFILGRAHFSGLAGKPGCPRIFGGAALVFLSAVGATCGAPRLHHAGGTDVLCRLVWMVGMCWLIPAGLIRF